MSALHHTDKHYTISLHDDLPICHKAIRLPSDPAANAVAAMMVVACTTCSGATPPSSTRRKRNGTIVPRRSEEHTSELQSHSDLVCRLLLEKKKIYCISERDNTLK